MGIETIITCDKCCRVIDNSKEDYGHIEVEMELDHNVNLDQRDEKDRTVAIFCEPCLRTVWTSVKQKLTNAITT